MATLVDLFNQLVGDPTKKDNVVLQDITRTWTVAELDKVTYNLAAHFKSKFDCKKGSCVALYMNKSAEYVISYIATLRAGGAYLPLDISYPENLLTSVLDEVVPAVVATTPQHVSKLPEQTPRFVFENNWSIDDSKVALPDDITPDDKAYIVYSSGTTGKPKGIVCPHRGAVVSYQYRFENYPYQEDDVVACNVFFVWELLRPILKGIKLVVIPDDVIYDPAPLCEFLKKHNVTRMLFTPSLMETVLDTQKSGYLKESFKKFRVIHLCGEVVTTNLLSRIMNHFSHCTIVNLYSISETHDVAVADLNDFFKKNEPRKFAPVGKVLPSVKVLILDQNQRRVPIGVPGEIFVCGPTLALGYLNRPELNKNRFLEVPSEYQNELGCTRMYRTGDWGYVLPNSVLEICGRVDTLVRIRGYGVELQAIEATLLKFPYVKSCAVESIGQEGEDKQLAAYIVLKENVSRKSIRAELKRLLPFYMVPHFFVFMEKLPVVAASSKIDRKALPDVEFERDVVETEALPQTPTEKKLAAIWADVLQHSTLDIQESFFDLGGHSLMAARLLNRVTEEFNVKFTTRDLFSAPTVYEMARIIDGVDHVSPEHSVNLDYQIETHDVKDNIMDLHLRAFWRSTEWGNRFFRSNILLTGVTGFLGAHFLYEILVNSQANVVCVVREVSGEPVEDRVKFSLKKSGLWTNSMPEIIRERVRVVSGDIALIKLGLSEEHYHFLTYDIDVVVHSAAYVNLIYPYQALHGINVLGTRNVLDFCHQNKVKPLHYISTDAVIPQNLHDIDENFDISKVKEKLSDGYSQSKYVAENLVRRSMDRGLPGIIYRLGNQAASSKAAIWNEQDFTYLMLKAVIHTGAAPNLDWTVEVTNVDFTSKFVNHLITKEFCENVDKTFHLTNSVGPKWNDIINWLIEYGYDLQFVEGNVWIEQVSTSTDPALQQIQKLLQLMVRDESFFRTQSTYLRSNTDSLLSTLKWKYPTLDKKLFHHWVRRLVEQKAIAKPRPKSGMTLLNKVCVVTGASEGIGEAIARYLAREGGKVVLLARQLEKLEKIVADLVFNGISESSLMALKCDVTNEQNVTSAVESVINEYNKIDVLVNCAGCMYYCMAKNGYTDEWKRQIDVNCHGTTLVTSSVIPIMIKQNLGHIVNITSDAGKRGFAGLAVYSGSKFYIEGFVQALRQELVEYNIKFTNIQPGDVSTKLAGRSTDKEASEKYDFSKAGHKILDPEDVAKAVVFAVGQSKHVAVNELLIEPQQAPI
ncbi:unnamed protein product [Bursaphelenchus okinawaensis]|uniref:Fatty acid synthase n=1 Tax=Bursaphelenchus okinawaensis TaxID=465554 RepID=A0A811JSS9_9BILA|nr:unnamed protein product [Bursaphelenchus okinawaensis]CAG9082039.1 unnamed protein product [Bursaphelenchus okinawaensis]